MATPIAQALPQLPQAIVWPLNVLLAHDTLSGIYRHALRVLNQEDTDLLPLLFHLNAIQGDAIPLLDAIEHDHSASGLEEWLADVVTQFGKLFNALSTYRDNVQNQYILS